VNPNELRRRFPNVSKACLAANAEGAGADSELEPNPRDAALPEGEAQARPAGLIHVRIVSVRKRLCDPDNLSPKWLLDCLRYCGAICDDTPEEITLETTQRKAAKGEEEHTLIQLFQ
jgi:hypothetical protein